MQLEITRNGVKMELDLELDLKLEKKLRSPRMKIWECWTSAEHIKNFLVPKPHKVTDCEVDLRVGGRFNTTVLVNGKLFEGPGVFLEIIEGKKLVFTDGYTEGWKPAPEPFSTYIILLEDNEDGGTNYTAITRHRSAESRKSHEDMGFITGWEIVADQLDEYASSLS